MPLVFVYGPDSLQARVYDRLGSSEVLGGATLEGWALSFNKPQMKAPAGLANLIEKAGATTFGVLYELTRKQIEMLEGYYGGYQRRDLRVQLLNPSPEDTPERLRGPVEAQVFVARRVREGLKPTPESVQLTIKGAEENSGPAEFIQEVKTWQSAS